MWAFGPPSVPPAPSMHQASAPLYPAAPPAAAADAPGPSVSGVDDATSAPWPFPATNRWHVPTDRRDGSTPAADPADALPAPAFAGDAQSPALDSATGYPYIEQHHAPAETLSGPAGPITSLDINPAALAVSGRIPRDLVPSDRAVSSGSVYERLARNSASRDSATAADRSLWSQRALTSGPSAISRSQPQLLQVAGAANDNVRDAQCTTASYDCLGNATNRTYMDACNKAYSLCLIAGSFARARGVNSIVNFPDGGQVILYPYADVYLCRQNADAHIYDPWDVTAGT
jgi:hypothetical protein